MKTNLILGALILLAGNSLVGCGDDSNRQVQPVEMDAAEQQKQYDDYDKQQAETAKNYQ